MSDTDKNTILIAGTGAMACLFAARLSASGQRVAMLGNWKDGLRALNEQGVHLIFANGKGQVYPVQANNAFVNRKFEYALVLVKSWQTKHVANKLADCLSPDGLVLSLQNGLGNQEQLSKVLGASRVALGITTAGATLLEPGRVRAAGTGSISIQPEPKLLPLIGWLENAGFKINISENTDTLIWGKLIINAAINPLTAILGIQNGGLLKHTSARTLMCACAREAADVAEALDIRIPYDDPAEKVEKVVRDTAKNYSSMLQDVRRGAPTEIEAINGEIVRNGARLGVQTPVNYTLWQLVKSFPGVAQYYNHENDH